jgi:L-iditol 2-dehydrogenase
LPGSHELRHFSIWFPRVSVATGEREMQCARLTHPGNLVLTQEQIPRPTADRPLIRVSAVGLCGSDAHWYEHGSTDDSRLEDPLILGHEFAGRVETGAWAGRRVAVDPAIPCHACDACQDGLAHLCRNIEFAGHGRTDGALRRFITWPERCLVPLPDQLTDAEGALLEPLGVALHAIDLARELRPAPLSWESVGVFGSGPIGLLLIAALRSAGIPNLIATDRLPHRVSAAAGMGATVTALATSDGLEVDQVVAAAEGRGVGVAFDASGDPAATEAAIASVRPGGLVVLVGIPSIDRTSFTASTARRKEALLVVCRRMKPGDLERAAALAATGAIPLSRIITDRFALGDVDTAFTVLTERRGLKVIVEP